MDEFRESRCPAEIAREVRILGTDWLAQTREKACGFGISAMVDIRLIKADGSGATVLATGEDIDLVLLDGSAENQLHVTMPIGRDIVMQVVKIPEVAVTINTRNQQQK